MEVHTGRQLELVPDATPQTAVEAPRARYVLAAGGHSIQRRIPRRDGTVAKSSVRSLAKSRSSDLADASDLSWLRGHARPVSRPTGTVRLVDLFSGCGALSLGVTEACRALQLETEHVYAADTDAMALAIYRCNFSPAHSEQALLQQVFGQVGAALSKGERKLARALGDIDVLAGGPPCQGHSDLNNHTRRRDPKNALFHTMIRAVEVLRPTHMILENVPGILHDKNRVTVQGRNTLIKLGYSVAERVLLASDYGVPQQRRRYFMVATRGEMFSFDSLVQRVTPRTLEWACGDIEDIDDDPLLDSRPRTSSMNRQRIDYLFDNNLYDLPDAQRPPCHRDKKHSYRSVYGRLQWDKPTPTITSGFNSPGQGRFVHPSRRRTLTPREAARIQTIPDSFLWAGSNREGLMRMIGNAVPPLLAAAVVTELLR